MHALTQPTRRSLMAWLAAAPMLSLAAPALAQEAADASPADLAVPGPLPARTLGQASAPVKMIEYASMTCSHCARFNNEVFPAIKSGYIDTGKVFYELREFPLDPRATAGFMLARCSGDQFFPLVDVMFHTQDKWAFVEANQVLPALLALARQAGLSEDAFNKCLSDTSLQGKIDSIKQRGTDVFKIDGTPTFFFNGKRVGGEISLDDFRKVVDPMLAKQG